MNVEMKGGPCLKSLSHGRCWSHVASKTRSGYESAALFGGTTIGRSVGPALFVRTHHIR